MLSVQIFGLKNSQATRAAERFFKERRVTIHMVDLKQKPLAPGEIKRFIERFSLAGLLDSEGKAYTDAGLKYYKLSDAELLGGSSAIRICSSYPWSAAANSSASAAMKRHGRRCSLPRERTNGVRRARNSAGTLEGLAHPGRLLAEVPVRQQTPHSLTELIRRDFRLLDIQAGSQFLHPPSDNHLFAHLRNHQHRHPVAKTFVHAVHAAVRDECSGAL